MPRQASPEQILTFSTIEGVKSWVTFRPRTTPLPRSLVSDRMAPDMPTPDDFYPVLGKFILARLVAAKYTDPDSIIPRAVGLQRMWDLLAGGEPAGITPQWRHYVKKKYELNPTNTSVANGAGVFHPPGLSERKAKATEADSWLKSARPSGLTMLPPLVPAEDLFWQLEAAHGLDGKHNGRDKMYASLVWEVNPLVTKDLCNAFINSCPRCGARPGRRISPATAPVPPPSQPYEDVWDANFRVKMLAALAAEERPLLKAPLASPGDSPLATPPQSPSAAPSYVAPVPAATMSAMCGEGKKRDASEMEGKDGGDDDSPEAKRQRLDAELSDEDAPHEIDLDWDRSTGSALASSVGNLPGPAEVQPGPAEGLYGYDGQHPFDNATVMPYTEFMRRTDDLGEDFDTFGEFVHPDIY